METVDDLNATYEVEATLTLRVAASSESDAAEKVVQWLGAINRGEDSDPVKWRVLISNYRLNNITRIQSSTEGLSE